MITSLMFARILYHLFYSLNIHSHQNNPVFHLLSHQLRFQKKTVFRRFFGGAALLLPGNTHLSIIYKFFCSDGMRGRWSSFCTLLQTRNNLTPLFKPRR